MTKMDDDVPATRGDLKAFATRDELKAELARYATKDDLKAELARYATKDDLKAQVKRLATKDDLKAFERSIEQTLTQTISAAYEAFRSDFRVLDDQDKAISERSGRQIGSVLAELEAHREDPKAHRRR